MKRKILTPLLIVSLSILGLLLCFSVVVIILDIEDSGEPVLGAGMPLFYIISLLTGVPILRARTEPPVSKAMKWVLGALMLATGITVILAIS